MLRQELGKAKVMDSEKLAKLIDHTLLRPEAVAKDFEKLCQEARDYGFYAICVPPQWVKFVKERLQRSNVKIASVVGFPHGNTLTQVKVSEAQAAIDAGADEIDMVVQIGKLKDGDSKAVETDIEEVVKASKSRKNDVVVKVILETAALEESEKLLGCQLAEKAGAGFVKTSTGFHSSGGATLSDVALLRKNTPQNMGIKASGGIRDLKTALAMIGAGASRLGCSSSVAILKELAGEKTPAASAADVSPLKRLQYKYAWDYFIFHAEQRTTMFNYFVAVVAGLGAIYAILVARAGQSPLWGYASVIALLGMCLTAAFYGLDCRNRNLVHRAERILKKLEAEEIFREERVNPSFKGLLLEDEDMEQRRFSERWGWLRWLVKHGKLIPLILGLIFFVFVAGAFFAWYPKPSADPLKQNQAPEQTKASREAVQPHTSSKSTGTEPQPAKSGEKTTIK